MSNEKQQFELAQAVKSMRENLPAYLELAQLTAVQTRAKYLALIDSGFNEHQALTLCKI